MNSIDLLTFAQYSEKLPVKMLAPAAPKKSFIHLKLLSAHLIDFAIIITMTALMTSMFNLSTRKIMVTSSLQYAFSEQAVIGLSTTLLPFIILSYFFFSFFMNHGQTMGMLLMKRRIQMESKNFNHSFLWACHSLILSYTCGLSLFFFKKAWTNFRNEDYLYEDFVMYKEEKTIDLLARIKKFEKEKVEIKSYVRAA